MGKAEVKGSAVVSMKQFVLERFGQEGQARWLQALPDKARAVYEGLVLPAAWYEVHPALAVPLQVMCDLFFEGRVDGAREAGRHSADAGLTGIYRMFVKLGSPGFVVKMGGKVFSQYYRPGHTEDAKLEKTHLIRQIHGFAEPSGYVEQRIAGYVERGLEISGARNVSVEVTKSLAAGHPHMEFDIRWE